MLKQRGKGVKRRLCLFIGLLSVYFNRTLIVIGLFYVLLDFSEKLLQKWVAEAGATV